MAVGRFAPSPTGPLHLGNLRTALVAWLFARSQGSAFYMRVEDLDEQRCRPEHEAGQLADLAALGLDWDGPVVRQSERHDAYQRALLDLVATGLTYPCYCSRREVREAAQAAHGPLPHRGYPGTCRNLSAGEIQRHERRGRPPALRLRGEGQERTFADRLLGERSGPIDDFVLRRNDGTPSYNLAVVVDDAAQGIEEVVRGEDLWDSTPRQLLLSELLDLMIPTYAHIALAFGPSGDRLAKRDGAITLTDRLALGETPAQLRSRLAHSLDLATPGEAVTATQLVERFDPDALPRQPWILDADYANPSL